MVVIMKFKKIYVEITNNCNLDCSFCIKNNRDKRFISIDEYNHIINEIKPYTAYVYLHLMGESLLHPKINEIINLTKNNNIRVNITTNGYLIDRIKNNQNIRQINISLQAYDEKYNKSLEEYLGNIFETIKTFNNTIINFRLWVKTKYYNDIIRILEEKYDKKIIPNHNGNFTLDDNVFISFKNEFKWPKLNGEGEEYQKVIKGSCRALKDHIGILSNLDVVACCMDSNGDICFGNLNESPLSKILESSRFTTMKENLENNIKTERLCQNCKYYDEL